MATPIKKDRLRWYQYSLRSLFILTFFVAVACSGLTIYIQSQQRQYYMVMDLRKASWEFAYEQTSLGKMLHMESLISVSSAKRLRVSRSHNVVIDESELARLQAFPELNNLGLYGVSINDAGLAHIQSLKNILFLDIGDITDAQLVYVKKMYLITLSLMDTNITDAGLVHIQEMRQLQILNLANTKVADAGLSRLLDLTNLEHLALDGTKITDAGLVHLQKMPQLKSLGLSGTNITNTGLTCLSVLHQLESLNLDDTKITDAGLIHLQGLNCLKELNIRNTSITDVGLVQLHHLSQLQYLSLEATKVTPAGINALKKALPNCRL